MGKSSESGLGWRGERVPETSVLLKPLPHAGPALGGGDSREAVRPPLPPPPAKALAPFTERHSLCAERCVITGARKGTSLLSDDEAF